MILTDANDLLRMCEGIQDAPALNNNASSVTQNVVVTTTNAQLKEMRTLIPVRVNPYIVTNAGEEMMSSVSTLNRMLGQKHVPVRYQELQH